MSVNHNNPLYSKVASAHSYIPIYMFINLDSASVSGSLVLAVSPDNFALACWVSIENCISTKYILIQLGRVLKTENAKFGQLTYYGINADNVNHTLIWCENWLPQIYDSFSEKYIIYCIDMV